MPKSMPLSFLSILFLLLATSMLIPSSLLAATGDLQVTCESGVKIFVDGKLVGETNDEDRGLFIEGLSVGSHRVKAVKPGFQPMEKTVEIHANQAAAQPFKFKIMAEKIESLQSEDEKETVAKVGAFEFRSAPMGAKVYLDGIAKRETDFRISNITVGRHKVRFELDGKVLEGIFNLGEGETLKLKAHFKKKEIINLNAVEAAEEVARQKAEAEAEAQRRSEQVARDRSQAAAMYEQGQRYQAASNWQGALERYENAWRLWSEQPGLEQSLGEVREVLRREEERRQAEAEAQAQSERAEQEKRVNGEYVQVPGGCFMMGDTFGDGSLNEKPTHEVCVDTFAIGKYEVSQGLWQNVMGNNPSKFHKGDDYPVEQVSWNDTQEFIRRLNQLTGKNFRLPTEAEWEYACRSGGKREKYCGGSNVYAVAWFSESWENCSTHPVGQKQPNGLGLYDMNGNVNEYVQDLYGYAYKEPSLLSKGYDINYYRDSPRNNPTGPKEGSRQQVGSGLHVIRGGGCFVNSGESATGRGDFGSPSSNIGFRLVLPVQ